MKNEEPISTAFMLTMRYQSTIIPLADVCSDYLTHLSLKTAKEQAAAQTLPFPAFKTGNSQKAEYFVSIKDLAMWIDNKAAQAKRDWEKVNH